MEPDTDSGRFSVSGKEKQLQKLYKCVTLSSEKALDITQDTGRRHVYTHGSTYCEKKHRGNLC